ncbi:MAG: ATP synthase F1 subunit epsilon [Oscillospiraceae bacterium]|jgi:F-type H+-transporting ATPase subunit epsilon|nr:ATP synthase F1 subunit epsilon [Oscillospiraceae bacterium]
MKTFKLLIRTPERSAYEGEADAIVFSTPEGRIGIMANHMPIVTAVAEDTIEFKLNGEERTAAIGQGVCKIFDNVVEFDVTSMEWSDEIDAARAKEAFERAAQRMKEQADRVEQARNQASMARALARLKAAGGGVT